MFREPWCEEGQLQKCASVVEGQKASKRWTRRFHHGFLAYSMVFLHEYLGGRPKQAYHFTARRKRGPIDWVNDARYQGRKPARRLLFGLGPRSWKQTTSSTGPERHRCQV